jgi:hypothetical protein
MDLISLLSSGPWVLLSPFVLAGSIILLRRFGGWSPLLQVIGSAAYIVLHLYEFTVIWLQARQIASARTQFLFIFGHSTGGYKTSPSACAYL